MGLQVVWRYSGSGDDLGAQLPRGTWSHLLCSAGPMVCEAVLWAAICLGFKHGPGALWFTLPPMIRLILTLASASI